MAEEKNPDLLERGRELTASLEALVEFAVETENGDLASLLRKHAKTIENLLLTMVSMNETTTLLKRITKKSP